MKNKSKQVWYLYAHNIKELKRQCYDVISTLYVQLGQAPEAEMIVQMTNLFFNDLTPLTFAKSQISLQKELGFCKLHLRSFL